MRQRQRFVSAARLASEFDHRVRFTPHEVREFRAAIAIARVGDLHRHEARLNAALRIGGLNQGDAAQIRRAIAERWEQLRPQAAA